MPRIDDLAIPVRSDEELRYPLQRPLRSRQPNPLDPALGNPSAEASGEDSTEPPRCCDGESSPDSRPPDPLIQPLQGQRQMRPPLGLGHRVDLVDDHRFGRGEDLAHLRGEHQVERLGRRDQDVRRRFAHRPPFGLGGVAGPQADGDVGADPAQRRPQVALDVVGERLQRRDVDEANAGRRAAAPGPACRSPRGSWRASCRTRSGRRSARWRHRRSPSSPRSAPASAPRRRLRTSVGPGALNGPSGSELRALARLGSQPTDLTRAHSAAHRRWAENTPYR